MVDYLHSLCFYLPGETVASLGAKGLIVKITSPDVSQSTLYTLIDGLNPEVHYSMMFIE